ncbi:MAG: hypothetical protein JSR34_10485 [Proteobacteria bacterium]|nr:hypothetical protein [Pseudomonadota bacterium]
MSSLPEPEATKAGAEAAFRSAFARLRSGCPEILPAGTRVTQNNVAREAGRDPSAFKKKRYPELVREIQGFLASPKSAAGRIANEVPENKKSGTAELARLRDERDLLLVQLLAAKQKIFEQWQLIQRFEASESSNVTNLDERRKGRVDAEPD